MAKPPESTKTSLRQRLAARARERWPQLAGILRDVRLTDARRGTRARGRGEGGRLMTAQADPAEASPAAAVLFCTECGRELPGPGEPCPACPQLDDRRREIVRQSAALLGQLRAIDAEENTRALQEAAGRARALVTPVKAGTRALETAVSEAIDAERLAEDRARNAGKYAAKAVRAEHRARRDQAPPDKRTDALVRKNAAAEVAADVAQAAQRATLAREAAEQALGQHHARLAALEDAAVAAERAAATPPASVPPGVLTCLLGSPLQLLLCEDLDANGRAVVSAQVLQLARRPASPTSSAPKDAPSTRRSKPTRPATARRSRSSATAM